MSLRALARKAIGALALIGAGCGVDNSLSGSVGELFSLEVSKVEVSRNVEALQINYFLNRDQYIDLVAGVTVAIGDQNIHDGTKFALQGEYPPGHQRTTVVHLASGEPVRLLPPVKQGDMQISKNGNPGDQMKGNFSMSFGTGGDLGDGRTLAGSFSAIVRDGGFGP
jgi:hypothetical protein